jgi:hypothetical protein
MDDRRLVCAHSLSAKIPRAGRTFCFSIDARHRHFNKPQRARETEEPLWILIKMPYFAHSSRMAQRSSFQQMGLIFPPSLRLSPYIEVETVKLGAWEVVAVPSPPAPTLFFFQQLSAGFSVGLPLLVHVHGATECELRRRL